MTKTITSNKKEVPLVRVKHKFQITIPNRIRERLNLEVGDIMEAGVEGKTVVLKPKAIVGIDEIVGDVKTGLADIRKGRVFGPFANINEFKNAIKEYENTPIKKSTRPVSRASSGIKNKRR